MTSCGKMPDYGSQVLNSNNLLTVIWFQVFLSNTKNEEKVRQNEKHNTKTKRKEKNNKGKMNVKRKMDGNSKKKKCK